MIFDIVAAVFIVAGLVFFALGVLGVLRFPDFFSRMHAAGKCDALAAILIILGFMVYVLKDFSGPSLLVALKIFFIAIFIFVASPTATHALVKTALLLGAKPWSRQEWLERRRQK
ncbi:MAG: monovalent cation/H(+) antiporter subunit G [Deltaproteobacteria bacterium]|nr:MAG: monovalent cation/H(+) antiporter subunit G [Deltaproteobacteria bacterium]